MASLDVLKQEVLSVVAHGKKKEFNLSDLFFIDESNLAQEFANQAALYAYFTALQAELDRDAGHLDVVKDREYSAWDLAYREEADNNGRKYTEPQIKSMVLSTEGYVSACDILNGSKYNAAMVKAIVKALEMRAEMLVSLGAHLRHELDMTGLQIKEHKYDELSRTAKDIVKARKK